MKTWKPVPINENDFTYATVMEYDRTHHFSLTVSGPTSMLKETWLSVNDYFGRASMPLPDNLRLCELVDDDAIDALTTDRAALIAERDALRERVDAIFDDGLEDFTERDLERYSQLSPPEMYRAMIAAQQRVTELEVAVQAGEWESVPDGVYGKVDTITVSEDGTFIEILSAFGDGSRQSHAMIPLPDNWRIQCRKGADNE